MSYANPPLKVVNVMEPRVDLINERSWVNVLGPEQSTFYQIAATGYSNSNIQFNIVPPGPDYVLDRQVWIKVPVTLTFAGTGAGTGNIIQPARDAFRAYPLSSCTTTLQVSLNNYSTSIELNQFIHTLSRFHSEADDRYGFHSLSPCFEDCYQVYSDADGANNNPLGGYINQACNNQLPRGAYPFIVVSNSTTAAVITANIYERVFIPPYIWQKMEHGGLTKLTAMTFNYTLANLAHMWSRSSANTQNLTSLSVQLGAPSILMNWLTPKLSELARMPDIITYPHFQCQRFSNTGQSSLAPNATGNFSTQQLIFDTIPEKLYIFLKKPDSLVLNTTLAEMVQSTDTFCAINSISINFCNETGVLSQSDQSLLWNMSVKNGLAMSYPEFNGILQVPSAVGAATQIGLTGSLIGIIPGSDFPIRSGVGAGSTLGKFSFQAFITATNVNQSETFTPDVYVLATFAQVLNLGLGTAQAQQGVASLQDILNAPVANISYNELMAIYGGSFGQRFKDFMSNAWNWIKNNSGTIAKVATTALPLFGLGEGGAQAGVIAGGKRRNMYHRGGAVGGEVYGGRMLSRADLAERLHG